MALLPLKLATVLGLGGLLTVALFLRPHWGLYLLPLAVPFGSLLEVPFGPVRIGAAEALVLIALGAWLAQMAAGRKAQVARAVLTVPFVAFGAVALLSLHNAISLSGSLKELLKWAELAGIYLMVVSVCGRDRIKPIVGLILLAGALQALVGVAQSALGLGPEGFLFPLGGRQVMRAYGTFGQPNPFGGYMALAFCLAYGMLTGEGVGPGMRSLALGGAVFAGLGLLLSLSRGAWLGTVFAFMVMVALWNWRRVALLLLLALVAAAGMALAGGQALTIFSFALERSTGFLSYFTFGDVRGVVPTPETWALIERLAHWQAAWEMFADHPWLGVGIGNYAAAYPSYALPLWEDPLGHAHNYYLNILAETGSVGLVSYLALVVGTFWLAWRSWTVAKGFRRAVAVGALGLLVAFSVHSLFDNLYVQGMNIHLGMVLGVVEVIGRKGNGRK